MSEMENNILANPGNDWSTKKVKLLKYWQEECRLYTWLYTQNVQYYQQLNRNLSISSILLSAITGATLLNNTDTPNSSIIVSFGVISILASFIQGLRQFLDLDSKISSNTLTSRQNSAIVIDIEEQLNLARTERINGTEFIKNIKTRKNEIIQSAPIISKYRWTQLKKKIQNGEGISFFNESIFKNYLDTTVGLGELKLDTTEDDEPATPATTSDLIITQKPVFRKIVPVDNEPTQFNVNTTGDNNSLDHVMIQIPLAKERTVCTGLLAQCNGTDVSQNSRPPGVGLELSVNGTPELDYSPPPVAAKERTVLDSHNDEDEFLNELQGDNLCIQQLRHGLYADSNKSVLPKHKLDSVLKYHMSRL